MTDHAQHLLIHKGTSSSRLMDFLVIDYRKYKGKGRPKKTDYCLISEWRKYQNSLVLKHIRKHRGILHVKRLLKPHSK